MPQTTGLDPHALTLLVEIIDAGNLSQAARRLRMTRANVSYHLAQLERSVGVPLVRRSTRRVEPTELGLRLYAHGQRIQDELRAAREAATSLGQGLSGRVGISVPTGYGQLVMAPWLIDFKRAHPAIALDVLFENRADNLRDDVDIAVRVLAEAPAGLVSHQLGTVRYVACATPAWAAAHGLPATLAALAAAPVITATVVGRHLRLAAYQGAAREEVMLEPALVSEHFPFLREAVLAGLGVGVVPDYVVQDAVAAGALVTTLDHYRLSIFGTRLYLSHLPGRHQTRAVRTCIDWLLQQAGVPGAGAVAGAAAPGETA